MRSRRAVVFPANIGPKMTCISPASVVEFWVVVEAASLQV
jgi:hypothetical protein